MDILTLARIQFGMTTVFHFLFVPLSIGLGLAVAIMETLYVIKKDEIYKDMTKFWGKIFLLSFAVGVVTGIIQEFQFGMNWSEYSRFMGDIFGAPLAVEALLAFFLESTFIGLWAFTWDKVKPRTHAIFMWLVAIGSALSALWILAANSFMQHPVAFKINPETNRAEMDSFLGLLQNPQLWLEFPHVILGAFTTGAFVIVGIAAMNLRKKRNIEFNRKSLKLGAILGTIFAAATMMVGHQQMIALATDQPMKFAAMEAMYDDLEDGSWTAVAFPDTENKNAGFELKVPKLMSLLMGDDGNTTYKGMNTLDKELVEKYKGKHDIASFYVPVKTLFWSFRFMAGFGSVMAIVGLLVLFFLRNDKIMNMGWALFGTSLMAFAPFIANTSGWLITELGRFPWTVYGIFTIADSVSPNVTANQLLFTNIVYFLLFALMGTVLVKMILRENKKGPYYVDPDAANNHIDPLKKEEF
ncbi:cytochrome ubiquinol oxidase subunit I [Vagococcus xieshaowenii]|uniref:Cytochrome ubiquinol oxidase subunit I n=1 Tax=Vagococcus xieshaowenii TaxID=2562451 RepID=A0AAJ5EED0_9ENTE|nr:cytochrome ubiquinol oxidase subunit I [Vagococcus xieshaowenii]QCA29626.1 cytochrome ubiquinol oxidase subunit I [Vagococcus xieshaowenii]TFZ39370.1 cytochrome ubiquinol oxidase subunit I [Vagococcus xieshaowenii]